MMEVPDWKFHLLERRRKEEEEMKRKEREEEDRLANMPPWKREIILRRKAKAEASMLETRAEVEGEQEEREKVSSVDQDEREARVLRENIGPVQQNPFIQLEKQRRVPELSCSKPKPTPDLPIVRTLRMDDVVKDLHPSNEEEELEALTDDQPPLLDERKGRVSRLLSRFGRSWVEAENGGTVVPRINGEGEVTVKPPCPAVMSVELDIQASTSHSQLAPPSPSCPRTVTGSQTLTQETTVSSLTPPSSSCTDSEPAVHLPCMASPTAMSGLATRPSTAEDARTFPFQLRSASSSAPRPLKQTVQASPPTPKHVTGRVEADGEGGPSISRVTGLSPASKIVIGGENQAMQRRKGNTITVNPRKAPVCENGYVATETKTPSPKTDAGKKRYPTVDEIKVIGGYQALSKSCLAKHSQDKKKLNISFPESDLEITFEYPSESSLMAEFGPPDESEAVVPQPQAEDDEEEESVLIGGIMRRKALIVDESCKR
ncbi:phostensin [Pelobates cultripes]|uniref:Phostensin n=1 Tax=Pelobates cultripes TaxID=61616 RepID=A0AAD1SXF8_PELCU|nr:phostensin [Pelobates cultripes]